MLTVGSYRNDGQEFGGSVYQKVNPNLETGVQLAWSSGNNVTSFGLGCVYHIDDDTSLRVSVTNSLFSYFSFAKLNNKGTSKPKISRYLY